MVWESLPRPFLTLAPMEDVTDSVYRRVVAGAGRPDLFFTEFIRADFASHTPTPRRLQFTDTERPIIAQVWGRNANEYEAAAESVERLGFDGFDINLGCAVRKIVKTGAGAALIGQEERVRAIIAATRRGTGLPVSVKTRLAATRDETDRWFAFLLECGVDAVAVHGRTAAQQYSGNADWPLIARLVDRRCKINVHTTIVGNGDVTDLRHARTVAEQTGVDGVMVGRAALGYPAFFATGDPSPLDTLERHVRLHHDTYGETRSVRLLRKFFAGYVTWYGGDREQLRRLYSAESYDELLETIDLIRRERRR